MPAIFMELSFLTVVDVKDGLLIMEGVQEIL